MGKHRLVTACAITKFLNNLVFAKCTKYNGIYGESGAGADHSNPVQFCYQSPNKNSDNPQ